MIYFNDVIFSKEECETILNDADTYLESGLDMVVNNVDYGWTSNQNKRKSTQCTKYVKGDSFIYKRINEVIGTFGYKISIDEFKYDIIKYQIGDFIWKHKDDKGKRIFSFVLQLNDTDNYEGGDFKYWIDDTEHIMNRQQGFGMIFKAGVYHEVTPVTKGERHSFVAFLNFDEIKQLSGPTLI